jgi:hypothetical protein
VRHLALSVRLPLAVRVRADRDLLVVDGLERADDAPHCLQGPGAGCGLVDCHRVHHLPIRSDVDTIQPRAKAPHPASGGRLILATSAPLPRLRRACNASSDTGTLNRTEADVLEYVETDHPNHRTASYISPSAAPGSESKIGV